MRSKWKEIKLEIKKVKSRISLTDFIITFEYDTKRKNHRQQQRLVTQINEKDAERDFWIWLNVQNEDKAYRAISNVKILGIEKGESRLGYF